ncbi:unnamed protein product [Meloidogyne enterolobii]|uniref:Uncharacterized protein n=1 Tax=Meloidogyne enterolobii TaxID=390850 RepID=A0ACB0Z2D8_MELEN
MINFSIILLNTTLYVLNFLKVNTVKFEKYSIIICNVSLVVAIGFRQWFLIKIHKSADVYIFDPITMYICFIIFFFIWEYLIITKRALNNEGERKNNCNIINGKIIFGIIIFGVSAIIFGTGGLYSTTYNLAGKNHIFLIKENKKLFLKFFKF